MTTMTAHTMPALDVKIESAAVTRAGKTITTRRFYKTMNPTATFRINMTNHTGRLMNVTISANLYRKDTRAEVAKWAKVTVTVLAHDTFSRMYNMSPLTDFADGEYNLVFHINDRPKTIRFTLAERMPATSDNGWIRIR